MNPQPSESIGLLCAAIVFLVGSYYFIEAFMDKSKHIHIRDYDLFTIGRIEREEPILIKYDTPNFKSLIIYHDCVDALHSLGMKKSDAKIKTSEIFENNIPNSVQEFLTIALKK